MAQGKKGNEKKLAVARPARAAKAAVSAKVRGAAARPMAVPPPHPMTAEQDRFEDEDGPFDDGVH